MNGERRLRVVQIACGGRGEDGHTLYALTEDGRVWGNFDGTWLEEGPIRGEPLFASRNPNTDAGVKPEEGVRP
ncbi:MAG: RCC1-like domain-containing protein [Gaiellaceae bacterium]